MANKLVDLMFRILADGSQMKEQIQVTKEEIDSLGETEFVDLDTSEANIKADQLKAKLDSMQEETAHIDLQDTSAIVHIDTLRMKLKELEENNADVLLHDTDATIKLYDLKAKLDTLHDEQIGIRVHDATANLKLDELIAKMDAIDAKRPTVHMDTKQVDSTRRGLSGLAATLLSLSPLLSPLGAVLAGGAAGTASAATSGIGGTLGLLAVLKGNIGPILDAHKKLLQLQQQYNAATTDKQRQAILSKEMAIWKGLDTNEQNALKALNKFGQFWGNYKKAFEPSVLTLFTGGLNLLKQILDDMKPSIQAAANAYNDLEKDASNALNSPFWKSFFDWLGRTAQPTIEKFWQTLGYFTQGFAALAMDFTPIAQAMSQGFLNLSKNFANWSQNLGKTKGFHDFIQYVLTNGSNLLQALGSLFHLIGRILIVLAPLGAAMLPLISNLARLATELLRNNPILSGIIEALTQIVRWITEFVGWLIKAHPHVSSTIAVLGALAWALTAVMGPWGLLVAAIAAGVGLVISHWNQINQWVTEHFGRSIPRILQSMETTFRRNFTNIRNVVVSEASAIEKRWILVWNKIKAFYGPLLAELQKLLMAYLNYVKNHWDNIWGMISSEFKIVGALLEGILKAALHIMSGILKTTLDVMSGNWKGAWSDIKQMLVDVWNDIKKMFQQIGRDAEQFGENLMEMFGQGIQNKISQVAAAAQAAMNRVRSFMGFHSPAEEGPGAEADQWAPNLMNMFIDGIKSKIPELHRTLSSAIINPFQVNSNVSAMMGSSLLIQHQHSGAVSHTHTGTVDWGAPSSQSLDYVQQQMFFDTRRRTR